jgi:hypothetical protein
LEALRPQDPVRLLHRRHRDGGSHLPVGGRDGDDLVALLVCIARGAPASAPLVATGLP